jgi:hypothetical protein
MDRSTQPPGLPLAEWSDHELIEQFRFVLAETEGLPDARSEHGPVDALREEMERRGLDTEVVGFEADAAPPDRETSDPDTD